MKKVFIDVLFISMISWLMLEAHSATSLMSLIVGISTMLILLVVKNSRKYIGGFLLVIAIVLLLLHSSFDLYKMALSNLGRDATLTDRTSIWRDVLDMNTNPLIGTGYDSFWMGSRVAKLLVLYPWGPTQAHNGYLEVYLNLGLIGLFLLTGVMVSVYKKTCAIMLSDFDYGRFRMAMLAIILIYNVTEAAFRFNLLFFAFLLIAVDTPQLSEGIP